MVAGDTDRVVTELRRGVVEHCVLALIGEGEAYAFDIVRALAARDLVTSEGTIYPLLARMRRDGLVTTSWRESSAGPPRRYYRLTEGGRRALAVFTVEWMRIRTVVDGLLNSGTTAEVDHGR